MNITSDALLHLRARSRRNRSIWIDSICTNQDSVSERNFQISMIFAFAKLAVIWLGKSPKKSIERTIEHIAALPALPDTTSDTVKPFWDPF